MSSKTFLVRLASDSINGVFENNFKEGIELGENASIALQNISFQTNPTQIIIDGSNDEIKFNISNTTEYSFRLTNGTYTYDNYKLLLEEIQVNFNKAMIYTGRGIGYSWQVSLIGNKINIGFNRSILKKLVTGTDIYKSLIFKNLSNTQSTDRWFRSGGTSGQKDSFVTSDVPISTGTGFCMGKIRSIAPNTDPGTGASETVGMVFGLLSVKPSTLASIGFNKIVHGIYAGKNGENYFTITNGIKSGTSTVINYVGTNNDNNDYMGIRINNGQVEYFVNTDGQPVDTPSILHSELYDNKTDLYPFLLLIDSNSDATRIRIGLNEFKLSSSSILNPSNTDTTLGTGPSAQATQPSAHSIEFESIELAEFLGFNSVNQPPNLIPIIFANNGSFLAQNEFKITKKSDGYIIELLNYLLNSYDGYDGSRRSIVATIPRDDGIENLVEYTPPYPLFIPFRNESQSISIRNLNLRILDKDLSQTSTIGLNTITLLLKSDK